ncbi:DUF479 domain-containing protein [Halopseudomonas nanhaiensis]|uniref:acyl carrier protein phosphodiesterase n=1 Tax=Halopseudomonas nanhaiensis TaxID=2830842 RepID=UPI001CBE2A51|nr:ACP phosphodiesterase [Halopseudomonas nanhaiensis]UAW99305.1 DUF479 domain-containing protein [Halopseudomonas nanhaiensis]
MNFLAHLYLGPRDPQRLLGSMLGDFVKGPIAGMELPPGVREGIWLHRQIDAFTDAHPQVGLSKARVSPLRRRYAGIMVDMFYDHMLARNWQRFEDQPLRQFTDRAYADLMSNQHLMPDNARRVISQMAAHDWLGSYARIESMHQALDNMARRFTRQTALPGAASELEADYEQFQQDFLAFMPEVTAFALAQAARLDTEGDALISGSPSSPRV